MRNPRRIHLGTPPKKILRYNKITVSGGTGQRSQSVVAPRIKIRPAENQHFKHHHLEIWLQRPHRIQQSMQGSPPGSVTGIHISTGRKEREGTDLVPAPS